MNSRGNILAQVSNQTKSTVPSITWITALTIPGDSGRNLNIQKKIKQSVVIFQRHMKKTFSIYHKNLIFFQNKSKIPNENIIFFVKSGYNIIYNALSTVAYLKINSLKHNKGNNLEKNKFLIIRSSIFQIYFYFYLGICVYV